jgi:hypothetical protein
MPSSTLNRIGSFVAGLVFMLLALAIMVPLPSDESWEWMPFPLSPYLEFFIGIPLFIMSLITVIDSLKTPKAKPASTFPLIDEFIGEQGTEQTEIDVATENLKTDERLLAIAASREERQHNRLAITNQRVILYTQENPPENLSINFEEIMVVKKRTEPVLTYLADIKLATEKTTITFKKVGTDYADQLIKLVKELKSKKLSGIT